MFLLLKPADMIDTPTTACARYGTGDFLKLNKRECSTTIELIPCGGDYLKVVWNIGKDSHVFWASSVVCCQFSSFVQAIYSLYSEGYDGHDLNHHHFERCEYRAHCEDPSIAEDEVSLKTEVEWDGEGVPYKIGFHRIGKNYWKDPIFDGEDPIDVTILNNMDERFSYTIDGHDLCYAVAKAYTEALKTYGFYGYFFSTGGNCTSYGDVVDLHMFLFLKAYALNAMEARDLKTVWENEYDHPVGSSFEKEIELLLFDM